MPPLDSRLARDAKTITLFAFRNGPLENLHAGKVCPHCDGDPSFSRITDAEMKELMQAAVTQVYRYLWMRENDPEAYDEAAALADRYTRAWADPVPKT